MISPSGLAIDSKGFVYVSDTGNHRIQKFDSNGNFKGKWGAEGSGDGQMLYPRGLTIDSKGFVYVVDRDNLRIQKTKLMVMFKGEID